MAKLTTPILLVIEREGYERRVEEFNEHIIKIGKLSSVNLRLDDPNVNRIHAVIEVTNEEEAQVIDMGSSKGTRVNGKRIHKARVVTGDQIILGDTALQIFLGEQAVAQARMGNFEAAGGETSAAHAASGTLVSSASGEADAVFQEDMAPPVVNIPGMGSDINALLGGAPGVGESTQVSRNPLLDAQGVQRQISSSTDVSVAVHSVAEPQEGDTAQISNEAAQAIRKASEQNRGESPAGWVDAQPQYSEPNSQFSQQEAYQSMSQDAQQDYYQQMQAQPQEDNRYNQGYPNPPQAAYAPPMQEPAPQYQDPSQYNPGYGYAQPIAPDPHAPMQGMPGAPPMGYAQMPGGYNQMAPQYGGGFAPPAGPMQGYPPPQAVYPSAPGFAAPGMAPMYASPSQQSLQAMPPTAPPMGAPASAPVPVAEPVGTQYADAQEVLEVRVLWGDTILDHAHFYEPKRITIGESRKNTFAISTGVLPDGVTSFPLIEAEGERLLINFTDAMGGEVHLKDQILSLDQVKQSAKVQRTSDGYQFALPAQSRVRLFVGDLIFEISFVPAPKRLPPALLTQMDHHLARSMGASFLIHGIVILMMLFADESQQSVDENFLKQSNRFAQLIVRPEEPEEKKKKKDDGGGAKAKGAEGKMGAKNAPNVQRRAGQIKKNPDGTAPIDMQQTANAVMDRLSKTGLLGLLPGGGASRAGGIITAKGFGGDDADALGGWHGSKVGDALGGGGLGLKGGGAGGGGFSGTSVGLGRIGTYGRGGGRGGRGWGKSSLRGKRRQAVTVSTGPPSIYGGLDRKIIQRVINQHRQRFKYCYERELIKNPQLQGKIHVWFQIEANGRVYSSRVSATTMNNDRAEQCLVERVRIMRFPAPRGGGVVIVNYPFIFRPS